MIIVLVSDDQQNAAQKQGLTPSPSGAFSTVNTIKANASADSTNGMRFLTVPGQNSQMSTISPGKTEIVYCARNSFRSYFIMANECIYAYRLPKKIRHIAFGFMFCLFVNQF